MNKALKQEEAAKYLKSEYSAGFDLGTYISMMSYRLLDSLVVECWLRVQSRTVSYQRRYKNGTSSALV